MNKQSKDCHMLAGEMGHCWLITHITISIIQLWPISNFYSMPRSHFSGLTSVDLEITQPVVVIPMAK